MLQTAISTVKQLFNPPNPDKMEVTIWIRLHKLKELIESILTEEYARAGLKEEVDLPLEKLNSALFNEGFEMFMAVSGNPPIGCWAYPLSMSPYLLANTPQRVALREQVLSYRVENDIF